MRINLHVTAEGEPRAVEAGAGAEPTNRQELIRKITAVAALLWEAPPSLRFRLDEGQPPEVLAPAARRDHPAHLGTRVELRGLLEELLDQHLDADALTYDAGGWYELRLTDPQPEQQTCPTTREIQERRTGLGMAHPRPEGQPARPGDRDVLGRPYAEVRPGDMVLLGPKGEQEKVTFLAIYATDTGAIRVHARHPHDGIIERHPNEFRGLWREVYPVDVVALAIEAAAAHLSKYGWRCTSYEARWEHPRLRQESELPPHRRSCHIDEALCIVVQGDPDGKVGHSGAELIQSATDVLEDCLQRPLMDYEDDPDLTVEDVTAFMRATAGYLREGVLALIGQAPFPGL